jgi:ferredoxin
MRIIKIDKKNWDRGLAAARDAFELYGPVKKRDHHVFERLENKSPDLDFSNTLPSPKEIIYPQSEKMFSCTLSPNEPDHHVYREIKRDYRPRLLVGIRPCDAKAFSLVRVNFDNPEYRDPFWVRAFEATTLFGLACGNPCSTCFCTTSGSSPCDTSGADALLFDCKDHFLAQILTEKGEAAVSLCGWTDPGPPDAETRIAAMAKEAGAKIRSRIETAGIAEKTALELYDAPFWDDVAFSCINCGACTYLCPTCWCFDIQDEARKMSGVRMRNWDSCMFPLFTLHGSGHNPRGQKVQRVRQRFMHKLKYYVEKYDSGIHCVGCGRCIRACPVNIDIRRVAGLMNNFKPQKECAA